MRTIAIAAALSVGLFTTAASAETFSVWGQNFNSTVSQGEIVQPQPQNFVAEAPDNSARVIVKHSHKKHQASM